MIAFGGLPNGPDPTPAAMRANILRLAQMTDARNVPVEAVADRVLPGPGGPLAIRIYSPAREAGPTPGLVWFHGGAGVFCSIETHDGLCRMLASASGCRVVAVEYRLAPEHKFPAAVEDACGATAWVARHAPELGIDPGRIAVGGDSAGGTLAAVVCQAARRLGGPDLALQVLFCPLADVAIETESRREFAVNYFLDEPTIAWAVRQYCPPGTDLADPRISPLRARDFAGLPPAHIHTAEFDPLRDEGRAYADRLAKAGVAVRYTCHQGMIHHFYGMAGVIPYARLAVAAAGAAIGDALA